MRRNRKPMTRMRLACTFAPKLFIVLSLLVYIMGGSILYAVDEHGWERIIELWGICTVILCVFCTIWLAVGFAILQAKTSKNK